MKITINNIQDVFKSKIETVDTMQLKGYTLIEELFCDNSGFGLETETALTASQVETKLTYIIREHGAIYTTITAQGAFQVYIGVFKKGAKDPKVKKVALNTYRIETETGYTIRYHNTDILTVNTKENTATLNNGDYYTKTTKERLNTYLNTYYIKQKAFQWYIVNTKTGDTIDYKNGITLKLN